MILYDSTVGGTFHELGTSGFLYRSNKLMYDKATQSLWNTLQGKPVIGDLVGKGIVLPRRSVVTTSWGAWRERHPETTVLSLETGYTRDYDEGVAYRSYFSTDELMFNVPELDRRLKNKAEVVGLVLDGAGGAPSLALSVEYLAEHPLYHGELGGQRFIALTDASGASRIYGLGKETFVEWDGVGQALDDEGVAWTLGEDALESAEGERLPRLPQHRAFWFGWVAQYPETRLVK